MLKALNDIILNVFSHDPWISFEKVFVEDNPKITRFYNISTTPFTIIEDKRFPGIATADQILKLKAQSVEREVPDRPTPGTIRLVSGTALSKVLQTIRNMKKSERKVIYLTKTYPEALTRFYGLDPSEMIWLVPKALNEQTIATNDIVKVGQVLGKFIDENKDAMVIIEGLELLIERNPLSAVIGLIQVLKFKVSQKKATAYILFLPSVMDETACMEIKKVFSEERSAH